MNHRERNIAWLEGKKADRVPDYEFGGWDQTIMRWHKEGLPASFEGTDDSIVNYFHTDEEHGGPVPWLNIGLLPGFGYRVLEDKGDRQIIQDGDGATCEQLKSDQGASIPRYLRYYMETREDWERLKAEKLRINDPARVPSDLDALCRRTHDADYVVGIGGGALYGWIRNWMGVENLSVALYEDPEWVEEMMEHLTRLMLAMYANLAGKCRIDMSWWWEDMCYKSGPLLSPAMFEKLMVPRYRRVTDFLRNETGCAWNMLDCDGNINALVELWYRGGINVMFPIESAHTDVYRIWKQYGRKVPLRGAFDKRALIAGPKAIDAEFDRLLPLIREGALAPHTDHRVPPDVSWKNYVYYRKRKCELIGKEYREG